MRDINTRLSELFASSQHTHNHLHHELPYRCFDEEEQVFDNAHSRGFGFSLSLFSGANDDLITALNAIVCTLPEGDKWNYQFVMVGNNQIGELIEQNQALLSGRHAICDKFAFNEAIYAKHSAKHGFGTKLSRAYHYDIKHSKAWLFVSTTQDRTALIDMRLGLESELAQTGMYIERLSAAALIAHCREHLNFNHRQDRPVAATYNEYQPLNTQILSPDSEFIVNRDGINIRHTPIADNEPDDAPVLTTLVSLGLKRLPNDFRLYAFPNCLASMTTTMNSLQCPHRISVSFFINKTGEQVTRNDSKISSLTKTVSSPMRLLIPGAADELTERKQLQTGLGDGDFTICTMTMNVTLYTTEANQRNDTAKAISTFRSAGLELIKANMLQGLCALSTLPFCMTEGFMKDSTHAGLTFMMKTSNLVNFLPVVADYKRLSGGLLLPTMRHQISFFDPFHCGSDNYNMAITGGSGAGKSFFTQALVKSIFARGGKVWILDKGESYKKLTQTLGGVYLDHTQIHLNPFTHLGKIQQVRDAGTFGDIVNEQGETIDPITEVLGNITALIATMASPDEKLNGFQSAILGDAILIAWQLKGNLALIDDVQQALYDIAHSKHDDRRISDIAAQLNKYCIEGIHGAIFNKPSQLDPNIDITTLELDGFKGELQRPVVFALMVAINQQMFLSGQRAIPKVCIIEEAWSLMSGANAQSKDFINEGYRTARKFGGSFATVTQGINDFFANAEAEAALNSSDIQITLRQGDGLSDFLATHPDHFTPFEQKMIKSFPRANDAGHSCVMLKAGGTVSFHRVFADPWSRAMLSTEPNEFEYCETLIKRGMSLLDAIEHTALHFYPKEMQRFDAIIEAAKPQRCHADVEPDPDSAPEAA
ncbi:type IV secretion system protein TraC [Shewanella psychropiezotolerans]|uniref:Type IV secretion system protein TraC n=1 Tax=Shewanella psychropiezotolerans TaxID=2593655 RepID=A0ABX5WTM2_9GAMM|nr:type IV secretion system protein TraC [Shewanella psychropiezotolerans]QDO82440.1 type IV secretion system protein TraC [Shewanella psychropiezotolerans]